ncbi:unnamed protein product [Phytophthora fragariaefolia]|uniref:Unnamed protein product n=1 Tax=Phytophthora fragariaefolia TaxID=1490495 RepID=A0A9W6YPY5_9STRA|nr:unnamed protein product [Phytophthora fragariaefolia]
MLLPIFSSTSASLPALSPISASSSSFSIDASPVLQSSSALSSGASLSTSSITSSSALSASDSTVSCANGTSTACEAAWLLLQGVDHANGVAVGDSALVGRRSIAQR